MPLRILLSHIYITRNTITQYMYIYIYTYIHISVSHTCTHSLSRTFSLSLCPTHTQVVTRTHILSPWLSRTIVLIVAPSRRNTRTLVESIESEMENVLAGCGIQPDVAEAARKVLYVIISYCYYYYYYYYVQTLFVLCALWSVYANL